VGVRRNPLAVFVLSIITFGAYWVYWYYRTAEGLRDRGELVRPAVSALAVTWGAFLVIPALVSAYLTANRVRNQRQHEGGGGPIPIVAVLLGFILLYAPYLQWHLNRLPQPIPPAPTGSLPLLAS